MKKEKKDDAFDAKMNVLHELRQTAMDMMGDKVKDKLPHKSMKEVSVMAPDASGLKKGLDMAKKLMPDHSSSDDDALSEASEEVAERHMAGRNEPAGDQGEPDQYTNNAPDDCDDDMSEEEIDAMISELQEKKRSRLNT